MADQSVEQSHALGGGQNFIVEFGSDQIGFSKVSNLKTSVDKEELREGGKNDGVHVLTAPDQGSQTLILEKGVSADSGVMDRMRHLKAGARINIPVSITLVIGGKWIRSWTLEDGVITSCEISELNALGSEVIVERIEITHSGLEEWK